MSEGVADQVGLDQEPSNPEAALQDLLRQRAVLERQYAENDAINAAMSKVFHAEDTLHSEVLGICNIRAMRAFLSVALDKKPEEIDDTLITLSWDKVREITPSSAAYAAGMRAFVAQIAKDRPASLGAVMTSMIGADRLLYMIELAAERAFNAAAEPAGRSAANIHEGSEAWN
jgi:hypothetical protein